MADFIRSTRHIRALLAFLIIWVSFAWGLPAEAPAAEGEAEVAPGDPWAGARISDAYDYAKCTGCGEKNEVRAESCSHCGCELPQPSAEMTDPDVVFVPGKGYYREGTLLEPGKSRKGLWITGLVLSAFGLLLTSGAAGMDFEDPHQKPEIFLLGGLVITAVGAVLLVVGFTTGPKPVYAFESGELYEPYDRAPYARRSPDTEGVGLKVEVSLLSF